MATRSSEEEEKPLHLHISPKPSTPKNEECFDTEYYGFAQRTLEANERMNSEDSTHCIAAGDSADTDDHTETSEDTFVEDEDYSPATLDELKEEAENERIDRSILSREESSSSMDLDRAAACLEECECPVCDDIKQQAMLYAKYTTLKEGKDGSEKQVMSKNGESMTHRKAQLVDLVDAKIFSPLKGMRMEIASMDACAVNCILEMGPVTDYNSGGKFHLQMAIFLTHVRKCFRDLGSMMNHLE